MANTSEKMLNLISTKEMQIKMRWFFFYLCKIGRNSKDFSISHGLKGWENSHSYTVHWGCKVK